ncbi:MAG: ankyrin repeat domain-containing protein [candidate division Zixibacteria bacterium]|nr:ankyrin repeat domain-containing protein [candidate division Zixibacteria bacterium]
MVFEFVQKCHFDLDIVKSMLPKEPNLLNSCWDWGSGDFETGLGGASHMGNREIALYLIEHGARTNIFAATMLGHLDIVQGFLNRYPDMINCKGPHGISLMRHAEKGGKESKDVLDYLKTLSE